MMMIVIWGLHVIVIFIHRHWLNHWVVRLIWHRSVNRNKGSRIKPTNGPSLRRTHAQELDPAKIIELLVLK